jgi:hypothetical protein
MTRSVVGILGAAALLAMGYMAGRASSAEAAVEAAQKADTRVFELRTYTSPDGKLDALNARFREHTTKLFEKHGMTNIVYLTPMEAPQSGNTLTYLLAHKSREAAKASWDAFRNDPEWQKARKTSEAAGPIVSKVESTFFTPTDYSPMK